MWAFANNDDIRAAIHAEPIAKIGRFDECSDRITYTHDTGSMIPIHADLVSKGMHGCRAASQALQFLFLITHICHAPSSTQYKRVSRKGQRHIDNEPSAEAAADSYVKRPFCCP